MIELFNNFVPAALRDRSGAVFNTGRAAFQGERSLYLLGLNPGGDPQAHQRETVQSHTEKVLNKPLGWAAYAHESWNGRAPGTTGMQPRVQHMFNSLRIPIGEVPMSNLIFERTRSAADLAQRRDSLAEACWPVHKAVLQALKVRTVLCMGRDCGDWVRTKLRADTKIDEFVERNDRRWTSTAWRSREGMQVLVLPHPAIASWSSEATDPTPMVARCLAKV